MFSVCAKVSPFSLRHTRMRYVACAKPQSATQASRVCVCGRIAHCCAPMSRIHKVKIAKCKSSYFSAKFAFFNGHLDRASHPFPAHHNPKRLLSLLRQLLSRCSIKQGCIFILNGSEPSRDHIFRVHHESMQHLDGACSGSRSDLQDRRSSRGCAAPTSPRPDGRSSRWIGALRQRLL